MRPVELPEVRDEAVKWTAKWGPTLYEEFLKRGIIGWNGQTVAPSGTAERLTHQEVWRLAKSELYWVDEQMTDLVMAAAPSMPTFTLQPEDLPSTYGMIIFAKPLRVIHSPDGMDDTVHVTAAVWGDATIAGAPAPGAWISWYTDTALNYEGADPHRVSAGFRWRAAGFPRLTYDNEAYIPFSDKPLPWRGQVSGDVSEEHSGDYPMAELRTAWTLMQQPVAAVSEARFNRADRRRFQHKQIEEKPVRVITLRRPKSTSEHGESDREYHHRWIVRGHWRQQWYPSRNAHRPVWIAPHLKGPEDAPLLGGDKVYSWTR